MKKLVRTIHLCLGLLAGLVFMSSCITGALLVFRDEVEDITNHDVYYVQPGASKLPVSTFINEVSKQQHDIKIQNIKLYTAADRSVEVTWQIKKKGEKDGSKGKPKADKNRVSYLNPYTGAIIKTIETKKTLYYKILFFHRQLLAGDVGKVITGTSCLVCVFVLITGIVLWWPRRRAAIRQKVTIRRNTGWKRRLYDLHSVIGFYCAVFLFISTFTGCALAFKWFTNGIYFVTGSPSQNPTSPASAQPYVKNARYPAIETALSHATDQYPGAAYYQVNLAKEDSASLNIQVPGSEARYKNMNDVLYFDQYTGAPLGHLLFNERNKGAKVRAYFLPLHMGDIVGVPSRIIMLLSVLIGASLPVTGTLLWWNRMKQKRTKK